MAALATPTSGATRSRRSPSTYKVIVADSRGHGRSTRSAQPYGYDLMASDVAGAARLPQDRQGGAGRLERRRHHRPRHRDQPSGAADQAVRLRRQLRIAPACEPDIADSATFNAYIERCRQGLCAAVDDARRSTTPSSSRSARCGRPSRTTSRSSWRRSPCRDDRRRRARRGASSASTPRRWRTPSPAPSW